MGQKVHPVGFRLGYIKTWQSRWFATRAYADQLHEDLKIRRYLKERLYHAGISRILFERKANQLRIIIHASRPEMIASSSRALSRTLTFATASPSPILITTFTRRGT